MIKEYKEWEAMLVGRSDSREVCKTFKGDKEVAAMAAEFYARNHNMEVLFMQAPQFSNDGFFGGVYAS